MLAKYAVDAEAARESDRKARALVRSIEAVRIREGAVRTVQGRAAIDWGGTEAAEEKAEFESTRAAKTVLARTKSKSNAEALMAARIAAEARAAEDRRTEVNRWEAKRRAEGPVRLAQGKQAIDWGGTEAAAAKAAYERARAEKTRVARRKSAVGVERVLQERHRWATEKVTPPKVFLTKREKAKLAREAAAANDDVFLESSSSSSSKNGAVKSTRRMATTH